MNFAEKILDWYDQNKRDLPWRQTNIPYKIWLSEIIMQQTQIIQGTSYYLKFIETYPTIFDLAEASEQDVLVLWQGLGYYSRARNLHKTANQIVEKYKGEFPSKYDELIQLKGVGDYTASAIASICFNEAKPAVDGNVMRVISRIYGINEPINKASGRNKIVKLSNSILSRVNPGDYNQAVMDFGSRHCKKNAPLCDTCIFNMNCFAYLNDRINEFPNKEKPKAKTKEYYNYFVCINENSNQIIIQKRTEGIWLNLYEFPLIVSDRKLSQKEILNRFIKQSDQFGEIKLSEVREEQKHVLSHKEIFICFYILKINFYSEKDTVINNSYKFVLIDDLINFPFPVVLKKFVDSYF